jgi:hypothetical protein
MNNNREENRQVIKDVLRDYTQQKQELRNRNIGEISHLKEDIPSMFNDHTYIVYKDTITLLRELVPHKKDKSVKEITEELLSLYNGRLESELKNIEEWYECKGYILPNEVFIEYRKIMNNLYINDAGDEMDLVGLPSYKMIEKTLEIYIPMLYRVMIDKKEDYTYGEMIREKAWEDFPL